MFAETIQPVRSNATVKLDAGLHQRLRKIAQVRQRTPHFLMREAIERYVVEEEVQQRFVQAAMDSVDHYRKTGHHVTHDEIGQWVEALKRDPKTPAPECHP